MHVGGKQVLLHSKGKQKGERLPPGAPCGVVYGQVSSLRSVDLTTDSRLRRADTPICKEEIPKRKPFTITVLSRAQPSSYGSTYLSGKAVQTNRATSSVLQRRLRFQPFRTTRHALRWRMYTALPGAREMLLPSITHTTSGCPTPWKMQILFLRQPPRFVR